MPKANIGPYLQCYQNWISPSENCAYKIANNKLYLWGFGVTRKNADGTYRRDAVEMVQDIGAFSKESTFFNGIAKTQQAYRLNSMLYSNECSDFTLRLLPPAAN